MPKHRKPQGLSLNVKFIGIIIIALMLGFIGGVTYSNHVNQPVTPASGGAPSTTICNCPNMPAGENPADTCKC
jgi:hypothetical protein